MSVSDNIFFTMLSIHPLPLALSLPGELNSVANSSIVLFAVCFILQWLAVQFGAKVLGKKFPVQGDGADHFKIMLGATLSLLGLIIGFTLSMAIGGFNGRQVAEEAEAEAIRTAYLRADLLPQSEAVAVRATLNQYLAERLRFYNVEDSAVRADARRNAQDLQNKLWSTVSPVAAEQKSPTAVLALTGINDLINAQQKAYAGWRTQVPLATWLLLVIFAVCCNVLVGYNARRLRSNFGLFLVLPLTLSLALMVIAEIDGPGRGIIREKPVNLEYLTVIVSQQ